MFFASVLPASAQDDVTTKEAASAYGGLFPDFVEAARTGGAGLSPRCGAGGQRHQGADCGIGCQIE
jgi:hypothetical protein